MESRICIVGENGAGKSTLLKILMDRFSPTQGTRTAHRQVQSYSGNQISTQVCSVLLRVLEQHTGRFNLTQGTSAHRYVQSHSGNQNSTQLGAVLTQGKKNSIQVVSVILRVLHRKAHRQVQSYSGNQNITQVCSLFSPTQGTRTAHK